MPPPRSPGQLVEGAEVHQAGARAAGHRRRSGEVCTDQQQLHVRRQHRPQHSGQPRLRLATGQHHQPAGLRSQPHRLAHALRRVGRAELDATAGVQQGVEAATGDGVLAAEHREIQSVLVGPGSHRGRHRHGGLEVLGVAVGPAVVVHDHGEVAASRVVVLPDLELVGLGRGSPVDVTQLVTGHVLPQGVEGEVAHRDLVARDPLLVTDHPGTERLHRDHPRQHQQLRGGRPALGPPEQPERVGTPGGDRTDRDHPAVQAGERDPFLDDPVAVQRRQADQVRDPDAGTSTSGPGSGRNPPLVAESTTSASSPATVRGGETTRPTRARRRISARAPATIAITALATHSSWNTGQPPTVSTT